MQIRIETEACPCGLGQPYRNCCSRYHAGPLQYLAPTAEALMRSRYSAFVLGLDAYLLQTWRPSRRPAALAASTAQLRWLGLEVRRHVQQGEDHAIVEFVARSRQAGRAQRLHETSRFVRDSGRWYYLDGDFGA